MTAPSISRARRGGRISRTQPFRILVASSAEPSSVGALRIATLLARRRSASVHALIVATPFPHALPSHFTVGPPPFIDEDNRRTAVELLRRQLATVRGTREWTMRASTGFPADSIIRTAARWPASLVVMGSGSHGIAHRLLGSDTAVNVITHTTVPVLAVPADARDLPVRAVAAVDFSDSSIAAARLAATLLGPNGTITLLYASPLIVEHGETGTLTDLYTTGARDRLEEVALDIGRRTKRSVKWAVANGAIVDRILEFAGDHQCDLITLGAHEPTLLERLLVGHVRAAVLREAACAVLVVPAVASDDP